MDRVVEAYAKLKGIPHRTWPAGWSDKGHMAGHARNGKMQEALDPATDCVVIFKAKDRIENNPKPGFVMAAARQLGLRVFTFSVKVAEQHSSRHAPVTRKARRSRRGLRAGLMVLATLLEVF